MNRAGEFLNGLDALWNRYLTVRSAFPYFRSSDIGKSEKRSSSFYRAQGNDLSLCFPTPITKKDVLHLNDASYWINQSFIIGAWALLEYYGYAKKLDKARPGFEDVNILRRLRKIFAHTNGRYNPSNFAERKLFDRMVVYYQIRTADMERFNLQIDEVLIPMMDGLRNYVMASKS